MDVRSRAALNRVRVVGGPTAVLELGGLRLVTDPTFSPPGSFRSTSGATLVKTAGPAIPMDELGPVDAVLLSHDQHPDNLDPAGRDLLARARSVFSTRAAESRLAVSVSALTAWQSATLARPGSDTLTVTAVPAQHGPDGSEPLVGEVIGFVLTGAGLPTVYISGDNASLAVVESVAERFAPIDVALLFVGAAQTTLLGGAHLTLTSEQAAQAARLLGAAQVIPLHFEGWAHFTEGRDALATAFAHANLTGQLILLRPGEHTDLVAPRFTRGDHRSREADREAHG